MTVSELVGVSVGSNFRPFTFTPRLVCIRRWNRVDEGEQQQRPRKGAKVDGRVEHDEEELDHRDFPDVDILR